MREDVFVVEIKGQRGFRQEPSLGGGLVLKAAASSPYSEQGLGLRLEGLEVLGAVLHCPVIACLFESPL